jgi:hypothetical protein
MANALQQTLCGDYCPCRRRCRGGASPRSILAKVKTPTIAAQIQEAEARHEDKKAAQPVVSQQAQRHEHHPREERKNPERQGRPLEEGCPG